MADVTVIGRGTRIRGRVSGGVNLEISGQLEGEVTVDGDVTIESEGLILANVSGRRLVVRGAVKGDLVGEEIVLIEDGARVVGDIRAPRVAIAQGALVRGYVQAGDAQPAANADRARSAGSANTRPTAARPSLAGANASASASANAKAPTRATPASRGASPLAASPIAAPPPAARSAAAPAARKLPAPSIALAGGTSPAGPAQAKQGPPPPVVPVLKKGAKGALNRKKA